MNGRLYDSNKFIVFFRWKLNKIRSVLFPEILYKIPFFSRFHRIECDILWEKRSNPGSEHWMCRNHFSGSILWKCSGCFSLDSSEINKKFLWWNMRNKAFDGFDRRTNTHRNDDNICLFHCLFGRDFGRTGSNDNTESFSFKITLPELSELGGSADDGDSGGGHKRKWKYIRLDSLIFEGIEVVSESLQYKALWLSSVDSGENKEPNDYLQERSLEFLHISECIADIFTIR